MSVFVVRRMSALISLRPTLAGAHVTTGPTEQALASAEGAMPGAFQGQTSQSMSSTRFSTASPALPLLILEPILLM